MKKLYIKQTSPKLATSASSIRERALHHPPHLARTLSSPLSLNFPSNPTNVFTIITKFRNPRDRYNKCIYTPRNFTEATLSRKYKTHESKSCFLDKLWIWVVYERSVGSVQDRSKSIFSLYSNIN
jgi:hypothetical protein